MFVLVFITFKVILRKLLFVNVKRLVPQGVDGLSLPVKVLFQFSDTMSWDDMFHNILGSALSGWFSLYSLYKVLKKYNNMKYTISLTRNVSRLTGWLCSLWLPRPFRYIFYGGFAKIYGINMSEVSNSDFGHYETFTKFFTRTLKKEVRSTSEPLNGKSMCSPCDGTVLTCGLISSQYSTIDCVKGRSYRLDEFMLGVKGDSIYKD